MQRIAIVLAGLIAVSTQASAEVRSIRTIEPRAFGYFLGDTMERIVEIETGPDDEIVTASLPRTGPSNYWLELRKIDHSSRDEGDARIHTLKLDYQVFYAPIDPRKQTIPATDITLRGPNGSETASLPPFTFIISPLREIFPEKGAAADQNALRPDFAPEPRRSGKLRTAALVAGAASLLFLILLARDLAWWPFHTRPARPFSVAARQIGRVLAKGGADAYRFALLTLHRAFDAAAGRRLLAADIDSFLSKHPEHEPSREDVTRFFASSRALFFGDARRQAETSLPISDLKQLAAALARQEREAR